MGQDPTVFRRDRGIPHEVAASIHTSDRVQGLSHNFYRYPARFHPSFARAAILAFTSPGELVLDPFMGGGTAGVEALSLGRRFLGTDVNPVAEFVSRVKTTPLSTRDREAVQGWMHRACDVSRLSRTTRPNRAPPGLIPNLPPVLEARIERLLDTINTLSNSRQRNFARCSILKTAQWALDNRREPVHTDQFNLAYRNNVTQMLNSCFRLEDGRVSPARNKRGACKLMCRNAEGLEADRRVTGEWQPARLVLTSPPYPGVHVLYHRWQLKGRKETPTPFWIVGKEDGHGASHYTMGPRYARDLSSYLLRFESSFRSVVELLDRRSTVVQLIGFSDPEMQLGPVLDALESAGLDEIPASRRMRSTEVGWRDVPNRKWQAANSRAASGREVLLIHRLAG